MGPLEIESYVVNESGEILFVTAPAGLSPDVPLDIVLDGDILSVSQNGSIVIRQRVGPEAVRAIEGAAKAFLAEVVDEDTSVVHVDVNFQPRGSAPAASP